MGQEQPPRATHHCRHYSWDGRYPDGGAKCALGVDLTAPAATLKCMPPTLFEKRKEPRPPCDVRQEYTDEERAAWRSYVDSSLANMAVALADIPKADPKKKGGSGSVPCKACGTGTLHWSRSTYNNHLRAQCTTPRCVSVIQ